MCVQVARAGRFSTKGLAVTFVSDETDAKILNSVQERFEVNITVLPAEIDVSSYSELPLQLLLPQPINLSISVSVSLSTVEGM